MLNAITGISQTHLAMSTAKLAYMETFKQRMKRIRTRADFESQAAAATAIGCERGTVGMWEAPSSPVQSVSGDWLFQVARAYKVRPDWINDLASSDDGHPWEPGLYDHGPSATSSAVREPETKPGYVRLQVMEGSASGGDGLVNEDYPEVVRDLEIAEWQLRRQIGFLPAPGRVRLMTVRGDSMYPDIKNGDVVLVDTAAAFYDGDGLYLINIHGHTFIKRMQMMMDGMHVLSTNPKYSSQTIPPEEVDQVHFGGRVLGLALMRRAEEV